MFVCSERGLHPGWGDGCQRLPPGCQRRCRRVCRAVLENDVSQVQILPYPEDM